MLMPWLAELQRRNAERERADKAMTLAAHPGLGPSWLGYVCPCCGQIATPPSLLSALGMWSR
jgi:hypothetical protein